MTIELGHVWTDGRRARSVALVDVPGHERLVGTTLAGLGPGAGGAARRRRRRGLAARRPRSTWPPCAPSGSRTLALVVTKADLADPGPVLADALERLARHGIAPVATATVSARTGAGLDARPCRAGAPRRPRRPQGDPAAPVRLWVDRSFTRHRGRAPSSPGPCRPGRSGVTTCSSPARARCGCAGCRCHGSTGRRRGRADPARREPARRAAGGRPARHRPGRPAARAPRRPSSTSASTPRPTGCPPRDAPCRDDDHARPRPPARPEPRPARPSTTRPAARRGRPRRAARPRGARGARGRHRARGPSRRRSPAAGTPRAGPRSSPTVPRPRVARPAGDRMPCHLAPAGSPLDRAARRTSTSTPSQPRRPSWSRRCPRPTSPTPSGAGGCVRLGGLILPGDTLEVARTGLVPSQPDSRRETRHGHLGTSRRVAIPVLERLDATAVTVRHADGTRTPCGPLPRPDRAGPRCRPCVAPPSGGDRAALEGARRAGPARPRRVRVGNP